jgi:hypothetical protein
VLVWLKVVGILELVLAEQEAPQAQLGRWTVVVRAVVAGLAGLARLWVVAMVLPLEE